MAAMPGVTIVVLNWNGLTDTLACLESLSHLDYPSYEVVVVDNGSSDGSAAQIRSRFLREGSLVTLIENDENMGFTGGNNIGLRRALEGGRGALSDESTARRLLDEPAAYALLLNNDTEVAPDFLRLLVEAAEADPSVGVAGPTIYYYDRPRVIWSIGGEIDQRRGRTRMSGLDMRDDGQFGQEVQDVDFVTGCAMLVRREAMENVGLLDERFFAYYEEAEWCVRMRQAGWRVVHVPRAHVWHKISPSARADSPLVHYYMTRNRLLFLRVTGAGGRAWLHTLLGEYLRTLVSWSVRPKWRGKRLQRKMMVRAIGDALRGDWGRFPAP